MPARSHIRRSRRRSAAREWHEEQTNDALQVIKSDVLHLRLDGSVGTRLETVERSVNELRDELRTGNARIIELLSGLVSPGIDGEDKA